MPTKSAELGQAIRRSRWWYSILILLVVVLGLGSRQFGDQLPIFLAQYSGDALWALMVYLGFGILFPSQTVLRIAIYSLLFAFGIEFSQLYHAEWIDQIRSTTLGGLVLGFGFLPSDLICYSIGISIGGLSEMVRFRFN